MPIRNSKPLSTVSKNWASDDDFAGNRRDATSMAISKKE
jgi:hypothetical protein